MSKKLDLLTKPKFQWSAVSEKPDLLTESVLQVSAVSKNGDLLTEPIFRLIMVIAKTLTLWNRSNNQDYL